MYFSRRQFVNLIGLSAGASLLAGVAIPAGAAERRLENIGIQLYTVRDRMAKNVPATLNALSELGYREVEFAGYFGYQPAEVRTFLADAGLSSPSTHIGLEQIHDSLEQTMDMAAEIGHEYVVLAYLAEKDRSSLDQYKSYVELFSQAGEAAKKRGLQFGYHNHHFEFSPLDGVLPYDFMLDNIDSELMKMTMDLYWITRAGKDPLPYFDKYPGRFKQCHVKDMAEGGAMVDVGSGTIDFAEIFAQSDKAGFEHYYVEHDSPTDSLQSAANSIAYLNKLYF